MVYPHLLDCAWLPVVQIATGVKKSSKVGYERETFIIHLSCRFRHFYLLRMCDDVYYDGVTFSAPELLALELGTAPRNSVRAAVELEVICSARLHRAFSEFFRRSAPTCDVS